MRQKRSETFAEKYGEKTIEEILRENTYGGSKSGTRTIIRQMPIVTSQEGIKMEWDEYAEEYPSTVRLKMTDGNWVEYQIHNAQPAFEAAMEGIKNPAYKRGYPRRQA